MTKKKPGAKKKYGRGVYDRQLARRAELKAYSEARRLGITKDNLAAQEERKRQDAYIAEEGCEEVGLKSVLDLPDRGKTFVFGRPA